MVVGQAAFEADEWNHFHRAAPDPVDEPSTIAEQIGWLHEAGFGDVDLHWAMAGQVLMSAWKPGTE